MDNDSNVGEDNTTSKNDEIEEIEEEIEDEEDEEDEEEEYEGVDVEGEEIDDEDEELTLEEQLEEANSKLSKQSRIISRQQKKMASLAGQPTSRSRSPKPQRSRQGEKAAGLTVEEGLMLANSGVTDREQVDTLKKVSALTGKTLEESLNDDLFKAFRKQAQKKAREAKSSLPASNRGATSYKGKTFNSENLSNEDHRRLWEKGLRGQ